jgi:ribosome-associated protein
VKRKPSAAPRPARAAASPPAEKKAATPRLPADVKLAIAAAQDKLAVDLTVLDLRNATAFTDFFIVCTGTNTKQVQAIAEPAQGAETSIGSAPPQRRSKA